jgi:hypothetical protein
MCKDSTDLRSLQRASVRLIEVQKARQSLARALRLLGQSLPSADQDLVFDLAMNVHSPRQWMAMQPREVQRQIAGQIGRRAKPSRSNVAMASVG